MLLKKILRFIFYFLFFTYFLFIYFLFIYLNKIINRSDWGATHSSAFAANAGLDMEMPKSVYFNQTLYENAKNGTVPMTRIDDMAYRILL